MILKTMPAWATANDIFRNDHALKMLRDTGDKEAHECPIERNS
jgi:hypothetical protein